jgi:hypothetical protein
VGRGAEEGGTSIPPQNISKNWIIKVKLNTKNEDLLPHFLTTPRPPSKEFENY